MPISSDANRLMVDRPLEFDPAGPPIIRGAGWTSEIEDGFCWTNGAAAEIGFAYEGAPYPLDLRIRCMPHVSEMTSRQRVLAYVDGLLVGVYTLSHAGEIVLPVKGYMPSDGTFRLTLYLPDARNPAIHDGLEDWRELGLKVTSFMLTRRPT